MMAGPGRKPEASASTDQSQASWRVDPDAGASAGAITGQSSSDGWKGKTSDAKFSLFGADHASVRVGSAAMPAPFALRPWVRAVSTNDAKDHGESGRLGVDRLPYLGLSRKAQSFPALPVNHELRDESKRFRAKMWHG